MPNPEPGEAKEAFVSRFMASPEARKDFPDEKQRAAVAFSKFGERRNAMALCGGCGAQLTGDAHRMKCPECGLVDYAPTPAVETIPNICPNQDCGHPLNGEHDVMGCHVPGCTCTSSATSIATPEDALSNAKERTFVNGVLV